MADNDIVIHLHQLPCDESDCCSRRHPNTKPLKAKICLTSDDRLVGEVKLFVFNKAAMDIIGPARMWEECQNFDSSHDGTKLDKIENFLANEDFLGDRAKDIESADFVLFIDQVVLEAQVRGRGRGLVAVQKVVQELQLPKRTVVMLQAGSVGGSNSTAHEAGEKLTAHWKRLGFREWSYTDESWLLLWLEDVKYSWNIEGRTTQR